MRYFAVLIILSFLALHWQTAVASEFSSTALFKPDINCTRSFIYKNSTYPLDSNRKQDGEGFRFLAKKNSQSEAMLNDYQKSRIFASWTAYTGTLGAITLIAGNIYSSALIDEPGKTDTRYISIGVGAFLVLGSYIIGQLSIANNEKKLMKAIDNYNNGVSDSEKIRVGLTPLGSNMVEGSEKGGAIQTQMKF
ncbi:MAG: hypothetical protein AB7F43_00900 [Bacteriovoracia bacterium]